MYRCMHTYSFINIQNLKIKVDLWDCKIGLYYSSAPGNQLFNTKSSFQTLYPKITLNCEVLLELSCRRSRRILFSTHFLFLLLLLSFFLSGNMSFSHTSIHLILTKLGHSDRYVDHYSGTNNDGVRGQDGVIGVKKVIFTKKASSPTKYLARHAN